MTELDYEKLGIAYYGPVQNQRYNAMLDQMQVMQRYMWIRGEAQGPLAFRLGAGQRVYDPLTHDTVQVGAAEAPLAVYLDPRRLYTLIPLDLLFVGIYALDTFLARIDFADRPDFDVVTYNRLRIEDLLRCLEHSNAEAFTMITLLGQFRQFRRRLRKERWLPQPPFDRYGFWWPRFVR